MKQQHTLIYIISSILLLFLCVSVDAQNDSLQTIKKTMVKEKYGLRIGTDLSKLAKSYFNDKYQGFEVIADFRLRKKLYLAAELGYDKTTTTTDYLDITTNGSYLKAGIDINMYQNWLDMDNMIFSGFRIGASTFNQNLNSYKVYNTNSYWPEQYTSNEAVEYKELTAFWAELILGIKVELFNNLYLGANVQLKLMANEKEPNNFGTVYIPGFNKTYDSSGIGVGYSYTLSYRIPVYKKNK